MSKNTKILALFAIACTFAVGLVNELTKDRIKQQEQQHLLKTLHSIIEPSRYDNDIANDCIMISAPELGTDKVHTAYIARKSGQVIAVALTSTAPRGYNGNIDFIMAINNDGSVSGVRVLKHQETPGLGDKIELRKSDWVTSFAGKKLLSVDDSRWAVTKDNGMFDQFTGATITPRAVVNGVKDTLSYFTKNKTRLLKKPNACGDVLLTATSTAPVLAPQKSEAANE
ncbi:electron transport complex subunit RsxG [Colwellia piezophila]|uniref:electron transport complex subunit RsxG n=1 Tax=Colwellia piezophila TaxID=211668 RepID=UPI0012F98043|nr:electron transport complex subunit RsxG [Colwellia piezophila]